MQVVSGPVGRRKVHFQAPHADVLPTETARFLAWANDETGEPLLIKAGLAHLWFVTLHPFDDGNGRIARAVGDLFLARADGSPQRFYSLSAQIQRERKDYYDVLERTQMGTLDATAWLSWFLGTLGRAVTSAQSTLDAVLVKARFWQRWAGTPLNERQVKLLNRHRQVLARYRAARHHAVAGTGCAEEIARRRAQHRLRAGGPVGRWRGGGGQAGSDAKACSNDRLWLAGSAFTSMP
jgi:Fic family protein